MFDRVENFRRLKQCLSRYTTKVRTFTAYFLLLDDCNAFTTTRCYMRSYTATTDELRQSAATFAAAVRAGHVAARVDRCYALADVAQAHADLQGRRTTGAAILVP